MSGERTYRREDLVEASRRWADGEFGDEWAPFRKLAADRGFIFPPDGTRWDSWEDPEPSQRAIVYRAIEDTPTLLRVVIRTSSSWGKVVGALMRDLERRRELTGEAEAVAAREREEHPRRREALELYGDIARRMS